MDGNHKNSAYEGGGYHFSSPQEVEEISRQRKAGWNWIKSIGSHIFKEGVNLTKISIPVAFFEPRSFLQRCCDNWCFIDLLVEAGRVRIRIIKSQLKEEIFRRIHPWKIAKISFP